MKTKQLAITLLICMITFAGFSFTTTDLSQDSNHDELIVSIDATISHGVVDLIVLDVKLDDKQKTFLDHRISLKSDLYDGLLIQNYNQIDRPREPDQQLELNHTFIKDLKIATTNDNILFRLARDGFRS